MGWLLSWAPIDNRRRALGECKPLPRPTYHLSIPWSNRWSRSLIKIQSSAPCFIGDISWKFHPNLWHNFSVGYFANKQASEQSDKIRQEKPNLLGGLAYVYTPYWLCFFIGSVSKPLQKGFWMPCTSALYNFINVNFSHLAGGQNFYVFCLIDFLSRDQHFISRSLHVTWCTSKVFATWKVYEELI